jgi:hypothetical protein
MVEIYFAVNPCPQFTRIAREAGFKNLLLSYTEFKGKSEKSTATMFSRVSFAKKIFVDSGGYSVRMRGLEICVEEYIDFLKRYRKLFHVYANLDTDSPEESQKNLIKMEKAGLSPLPVWHINWGRKMLEQYVKKYNYIALGGIAGRRFSTKEIERITFAIQRLYRKTKFHLFGITISSVIRKTKPYSVDSTSWLSGGKYGMFFTFAKGRLISSRNFKKFKKLSYKEMDLWNAIQWQRYADYLKEKKI